MPTGLPEADRLFEDRDLPYGFVLKPLLDGGTYGSERLFTFRMVLVEELIRRLPYVIIPFNELGRAMIGVAGRNRLTIYCGAELAIDYRHFRERVRESIKVAVAITIKRELKAGTSTIR